MENVRALTCYCQHFLIKYQCRNIIILFILVLSCVKSKHDNVIRYKNTTSSGPENGTMFIGGGGMTDDLWRIFNEFGGGDTARLVVIPTSWDGNSINYDPDFSIIHEQFLTRVFKKWMSSKRGRLQANFYFRFDFEQNST